MRFLEKSAQKYHELFYNILLYNSIELVYQSINALFRKKRKKIYE